MNNIFFTEAETQFLSPLIEKRLKTWQENHLSDKATRKRFEKSYLVPLSAAFAKLFSSIPQKYTAMEKAIITGCIKECLDPKEAKSPVINDLLKKLEIRKRHSHHEFAA